MHPATGTQPIAEKQPPHEPDRRWYRRADLRIRQADNACWNVLDPVTRHSYRVGLAEHWLLTRPDGRQSSGQLWGRLRRELPSLQVTDEDLASTMLGFARAGLLTCSGSPPASNAPAGKNWQELLGNTVVWQIRGLNPDRWLSSWAGHTNWLFSARAVRVWLWLTLITLCVVLLDFQRLATQSLSLAWILHPTTAGSLLVVFVCTRAVHELGHALVCKRFGVRCPDIGLFVILGAPCVYCDVSESWQLPKRSQRAAVAAAGMYVEFIVATLAAWLWLSTVAGPTNTLALQTMLVCSISTLVINANPLMRFDGYYILTDWLDEVNLRSKADRLAGTQLKRLVLGDSRTDSQLPIHAKLSPTRRRLLIGFSLAGWLYRAMLSLTIAGLLVNMYTGWNLPWVGRFLATAILVSWWGIPMVKLLRELWQSAGEQSRRWRLSAVAALLTVTVAWLPIPNRQWASGWLQPQQSHGVYAGTAAQLSACNVRDGQIVEVGQALFELRSEPLNSRLVRYQQARRIGEIRLEAATRMRDMHSQDVDLQHDAHQLAAADSRLASLQREISALSLTAPVAGRLVAMPVNPADHNASMPAAGFLGAAVGGLSTSVPTTSPRVAAAMDGAAATHWCEPPQLERVVSAGTLLACVCSTRSIVVIPLTEQQLSYVAAGTTVRLRLPYAQRTLAAGQVQSVVQMEQLASPWQAAALTAMDQVSLLGGAKPRMSFAAVIELPADVEGLPGASVDAVFSSETTTLYAIAQRWLASNLRLMAD